MTTTRTMPDYRSIAFRENLAANISTRHGDFRLGWRAYTFFFGPPRDLPTPMVLMGRRAHFDPLAQDDSIEVR